MQTIFQLFFVEVDSTQLDSQIELCLFVLYTKTWTENNFSPKA